MTNVGISKTFAANQALEKVRDFLTKGSDFVCTFGRSAFKADKMGVVCLPNFRLEGSGLEGAQLSGSVSQPARLFGDSIQNVLTAALKDYKDKKHDGIIFIDPFSLRQDDHITAYNRTWTMYAELGVATLKLFSAPDIAEIVRSSSDDSLRSMIYDQTNQFAHPINFEYYKSSGQLADGDDNFHYFCMNNLFPEGHPRKAPCSMMVLTNLISIENARSEGQHTSCPVGENQVASMYQRFSKHPFRPYDAELPYIMPDNELFDPPLFRKLLVLSRYYRTDFPKDSDKLFKACTFAYFDLNAQFAATQTKVHELKVLECLRQHCAAI